MWKNKFGTKFEVFNWIFSQGELHSEAQAYMMYLDEQMEKEREAERELENLIDEEVRLKLGISNDGVIRCLLASWWKYW